jgi:hypothetical protein
MAVWVNTGAEFAPRRELMTSTRIGEPSYGLAVKDQFGHSEHWYESILARDKEYYAYQARWSAEGWAPDDVLETLREVAG